MNTPNKLVIFRFFLALAIVIILLFPFDAAGIPTIKLFVNETIVVDIKHLIVGALFVIASISDFLDGYIARKTKNVTNFGKFMDAMADKVLVNSSLIILSATGFIHPIIPVIIIGRDTVVNGIKLLAVHQGVVTTTVKTGKVKTAFLMIGITLTLFYNLPFELMNLQVAEFLLIVATILSVISGVQYFNENKEIIFGEIRRKKEQ